MVGELLEVEVELEDVKDMRVGAILPRERLLHERLLWPQHQVSIRALCHRGPVVVGASILHSDSISSEFHKKKRWEAYDL